MRTLILSLSVPVLCAACDPAEPPPDAAMKLREGLKFYAAGDLEGAIRSMDQALALDAGRAEAYHVRGVARNALGRVDEALQDLGRCLELDPFRVATLYSRGTILLRRGEFAKAEADFSKALQRDSGYVRALSGRALARSGKGDLAGAAADLDEQVRKAPKAPESWAQRGMFLADAGKWKEAAADLKKAVDLDPKGQETVRLHLWAARSRAGEREEASKELQVYVEARKTSPSGDWFATAAGFLLGRVSEEDLHRKAEVAEQRDPWKRAERCCEAHLLAGRVRLIAGDRAGAEKSFSSALSLQAQGSAAHRAASLELAQMKKG